MLFAVIFENKDNISTFATIDANIVKQKYMKIFIKFFCSNAAAMKNPVTTVKKSDIKNNAILNPPAYSILSATNKFCNKGLYKIVSFMYYKTIMIKRFQNRRIVSIIKALFM